MWYGEDDASHMIPTFIITAYSLYFPFIRVAVALNLTWFAIFTVTYKLERGKQGKCAVVHIVMERIIRK